MYRSTLLCALACAAAFALLAPAAQGDIRYTERATGAISITWRGDPARGCAEVGLCDHSGSLRLPAGGGGSGVIGGSEPSAFRVLEALNVTLGSGMARVLRGPPGEPAGACTDRLAFSHIHLQPAPLPGGRARLTPALFSSPFQRHVGGAIAGRCAGPLAADVSAAMPTVEILRRQAMSGRLRIDLSTRRSFASGPFSGEIVSTVVMTRRSQIVGDREPGERLAPPPPPRPGRSARPRLATVILSYAVERVDGELSVGFAGGPPPFCEAFDACGLSGSVRVRARAPVEDDEEVDLYATGLARAIRGRTRRAAIDALQAGRLRLMAGGSMLSLPGSVDATAERAGGATCRDGRDVRLPPVELEPTRRGVDVTLASQRGPFEIVDDPLRTRCPGPALADLPSDAFATAAIARRELGAETILVPLRVNPAGAAAPFALSGGGELVLVLRRQRVSVHVERRA